MSNKKTLKVFSTASIAGMIAAAVVSSQAFAAVDAYSVKVGEQVYKYDKAELTKSFLDSKRQKDAKLYDDFVAKLTEAKGFYAFNDTKNGYVDFNSIQAKFKEAKRAAQQFNLDEFTESKDAKVVKIEAVKKAVVNKDGKVEYVDETSKDDEKGDLKVTSVEALSLKQVKINFNKAVTDQDKIDDIEDKENYTWESSERDELKNIIDKVEMDESGKFAILTFKDEFDEDNGYVYKRPYKVEDGIVNQETYKVIIDENVTGKEVTEKVKFDDAERPEVKGIEVVGKDTIKVRFSEPIKPDEQDKISKKSMLKDESFKINNDNISVNEVELVNNGREANIKLGTNLKDGEKVKVEVKGIIEDYAGFGIKVETDEIVVKADTKAPEVVAAKNVKKGEVTLVFDKDIKFKGNDDKIKVCKGSVEDFFDNDKIKDSDEIAKVIDRLNIQDSDKYEEYTHTNDKDKAYAVKVDGKELTMYFDEDEDGIPNGPVVFWVKSGEIESLWEEENAKVRYEVTRESDTTKPEVKSVKQDEDDSKLIKIKFNKELDREEAEKKDNYEIVDESGDKVTIKEIDYNNSDKEVKITTNKKLDGGEYKVTIKKVEDKYGNVMDTVTKKFTGSEKEARKASDLKVNVYNAGENNQKIVIDFDTKMKTEGEYSIKDLTKYTLVAKDGNGNPVNVFKGNKSSVSLDGLYNVKAKDINDGKKVEITLPYKDSKDNSYDLTFKDGKYNIKKDATGCATLELQVGKVSDVNDNVNNTVLIKNLDEDLGTIDVDDDNDDKLVRAMSTDEIEVAFKDKVNIKNKDFKVYAIPQAIANQIIATQQDEHTGYKDAFDAKVPSADLSKYEVNVSSWNNNNNNSKGNTVLKMKLNKNDDRSLSERYDDKLDHVMNYDGTIGENHDVLFVQITEGESKNDYDAKLTSSVYRVVDHIAPALVDNNKRDDKKGRFIGTELESGKIVSKFGKSDNKDEAVEYYRAEGSGKAAIVLTYEEAIEEDSISKNTFTVDQADDFKTVKLDKAYVSDADPTKVVIEVSGLDGIKEDDQQFGVGFDIIQISPIRDNSGDQFVKGEGNQSEVIKTQIGDFTPLKAAVASKLVKDPTIVEEATKEVTKENVEKAVKAVANENINVSLDNTKNEITVAPKAGKEAANIGEVKLTFAENTTISEVKATDKDGKAVDLSAYFKNGSKTAKEFSYNFAADSFNSLKGAADKVTLKVNGVEYTVNFAK